jgi:hypothetical protein
MSAEIRRPPDDASDEEIQRFRARRCGACGHRADEHRALFGSPDYLCPTVATFIEEDSEDAPDELTLLEARDLLADCVERADRPDGINPFLFDTMSLVQAKQVLGAICEECLSRSAALLTAAPAAPRDDDALERALAFVAEFKGDPRCGLNCLHSEALAAEVHRLRAVVAPARSLVTAIRTSWRFWRRHLIAILRRAR